jgi:hypothetical protein
MIADAQHECSTSTYFVSARIRCSSCFASPSTSMSITQDCRLSWARRVIKTEMRAPQGDKVAREDEVKVSWRTLAALFAL